MYACLTRYIAYVRKRDITVKRLSWRVGMQDPEALKALSKFVGAMDQLDEDVAARNAGPSKIRSETGSRGFPYTLLAPTSPGPGVTGRGIPNSTCI